MKRKVTLLVLLLAGLAGVALLWRRPPPVPAPVVLHPSAQQVASAQQRLQALMLDPAPPPPVAASPARTSHPIRARHSPSLHPALPPKRRTLRLSEQDLNVYLAGSHAARKMLAARHIQALQIVLTPPSALTLRAAVVWSGRTQNVQVDGLLAADPKRGLRYTASQAQVGRLPLPPALVTHQADTLAARFFAQAQGRLPLTIQAVQVQGKTLVLTGVPAPRHAATRRSASPARR